MSKWSWYYLIYLCFSRLSVFKLAKLLFVFAFVFKLAKLAKLAPMFSFVS